MSQAINNKKTRVVMALFLHSRGFSLAVLEDAMTVLNAYNVVIHSYPISNKSVMKRVKEKIYYYLPEIVILENPYGYGSRKGKRVQRAISDIEAFATSIHLKVNKYSRNDIRYVFNNFNAHSKYEIAKVITENVQNLPVELPEKRLSHRPEHYSMNIFDAISLGITHFYQS